MKTKIAFPTLCWSFGQQIISQKNFVIFQNEHLPSVNLRQALLC